MPFVANTPESLIARSDSKKSDATCRGITANGRPCRRPIAASRTPPPANSLAPGDDPSDESLYCWQHKEQAGASTRSSPGRRRPGAAQAIAERSSLDTLADRLGLELNLKERTPTVASGGANASKDDTAAAEKRRGPTKEKRSKKAKPKSMGFCFCFSIPREDAHDTPRPRPHRPRPRPQQQPDQQSARPSTPSASVPNAHRNSKQQQRQQQHISPSCPRRHPQDRAAPFSSLGCQSYRSAKSAASSTTARLKSLIPDSLDAPAASSLMAELARPPSDADEPGYIYMFWLTPASASASVPVDAARALLVPPPPPPSSSASSRGHPSRRASDVVSSFAGQAGGAENDSKTMLLKIGRAANVQRRMNQWSRQCGYSIQMLRYYPYHPSSSSSAASVSSPPSLDPTATTSPRTTPHCKKVERLVHIELSGMGLRAKLGTCEACAREHREWFQVQASREGIRIVDEVIRRWIEWDDGGWE